MNTGGTLCYVIGCSKMTRVANLASSLADPPMISLTCWLYLRWDVCLKILRIVPSSFSKQEVKRQREWSILSVSQWDFSMRFLNEVSLKDHIHSSNNSFYYFLHLALDFLLQFFYWFIFSIIRQSVCHPEDISFFP